MSITTPKNEIAQAKGPPLAPRHPGLRTWLTSWEIYPLLLVTGFLCLYGINTTEFNPDQAALFSLARNAIRYGMIPVTSNAASVGLAHPPGVIYLLMVPALFSANPMWAAVQQGLLTTIAVLLTYIFTRRYYGRLAAIGAALLYGTAASTIHFGRFIWQPNVMAPLVVLFLFALFWGVVERRKGWLPPAVLLLGLILQSHESASLLIVLLLIAVVLAFKTLRWRDVVWAGIALFIVYLPFLFWEYHVHLADLHALFSLSKQQAVIDSEAIRYYRAFLLPFGQQPTIPSSVINAVIPYISWMRYAMPLLVLCGVATVSLLILQTLSQPATADDRAAKQGGIRGWWNTLQATPAIGGYILLLVWQLLPLLVLSRHTVILQMHYLFFLMPGPFILIGLFSSNIVAFFRQYRPQWSLVRFGIYALLGIIVLAQVAGSVASVIDITSGNFDDRTFYVHYRSDLNSLQHALGEADQLAQQRHLSHVYITTDASTSQALNYLAAQMMHTPTTLFDATNCLVLPDPNTGPAVLLVGPYDALTNALLGQFAAATLVEQSARLGGAPFRLYLVTPPTVQSSPTTGSFDKHLQMLQAQSLNVQNAPWLVTRWSLLRSATPALRTSYNYTMTINPNGNNTQSQSQQCSSTALQAGEQLLVAFPLSKKSLIPTSVTVGVQYSMTQPYNPTYGPLHFETYLQNETPLLTLHTPNGANTITVPLS